MLAVGAMEAGRIDEAERIFDEIEAEDCGAGIFGAAIILLCGRAELDLAAGRIEAGLRAYRDAVRTLSARRFPGFEMLLGFEPWTLYAEAAAVVAHVRHGRPEEVAGLRRDLLRESPEILDGAARLPRLPGLRVGRSSRSPCGSSPPTPTRPARPSPYACSSTPTASATTGSCPAWPGSLPSTLAEAVLPGEEARVRAEIARPEGNRAPHRGQGPRRGAG